MTLRDYGLQELERNRLISLVQQDNRACQKVTQHIGRAVEKEVVLSEKNGCVCIIEKEENDGIYNTGNRAAALRER